MSPSQLVDRVEAPAVHTESVVADAAPDGNNRFRSLIGYLALVCVPVLLVVALLAKANSESTAGSANNADSVSSLPYRLLLAITLILALCRITSVIAMRLGQPSVIGELLTGILVGPSVLGALAPEVWDWLFTSHVLTVVNGIAQLGVVLFMFLVGAGLPLHHLRSTQRHAVVLGHAALAIPFLLGTSLAFVLDDTMRPAGIGFVPFALFCGIALSITAFPVLARILTEQRLADTPLGALGLATAGIVDVTAWLVLGVIVLLVKQDSLTHAGINAVLAVGYGVFMYYLARPWLAGMLKHVKTWRHAKEIIFAIVICLLLLSAAATDLIGLHTIFGAFVAGLIMPRTESTTEVTEITRGFTTWFALPLFFVSVGLSTSIGALTDPAGLAILALVLVAAVAGKMGATAVAGRTIGYSWRDSWALGAMMNCRGLTELIVLNVGVGLGVITKDLFTILVAMALITTAATGPALAWLTRARSPSKPRLLHAPLR